MAFLDWVETWSRLQRYGGRNYSYDSNQPGIGNNNYDLWRPELPEIPGDWEFFGGKWYSGVLTSTYPISAAWSGSSVSSSFRDMMPISHEYDNFDIFMRRLTCDFYINTAHSGTAFLTIQPRYFISSTTGDFNNPAVANLTTNFNTSSMTTGNRIYRITRNINTFFTNFKGAFIEGTKTGSPAGFNATIALSYRIVRK